MPVPGEWRWLVGRVDWAVIVSSPRDIAPLWLNQTDFQCRPRLWKFLALSIGIHRKYRSTIWRVSNFFCREGPLPGTCGYAVALSEHMGCLETWAKRRLALSFDRLALALLDRTPSSVFGSDESTWRDVGGEWRN